MSKIKTRRTWIAPMNIKSKYVLITCGIVAVIFLISEVKITRNGPLALKTEIPKGTAVDEVQAATEVQIARETLAERQGSSTALGAFAMAMRDQYKLTDKEAEVVDEAFKAITAKREALELSLAKREETDQNSVMITIPEYAMKGMDLFDEFYGHISNGLGSVRAKEIIAVLEPRVKANNNGLGAVEQKILIEDKGASVHIVHGSGSFLDINGAIHIASRTTVSNLLKNHLLSYAYMEPLFPNKKVNSPN